MAFPHSSLAVIALFLGLNSLTPVLAGTTKTPQTPATKPTTTNPPAQTYQPGFWQPVARFNPKQKVTLKLVNDLGVVLNYDDTTQENSDPKNLAIAATDIVPNVGKNAYIMVYPVDNIDPDSPLTMKFDVAVDEAKNIVTVTITKAEKGFMGHRTINLQKNGGIYFY